MTHLPTPNQIHQEIKAPMAVFDFIEKTQQAICAILKKEDNRKILIVGPCSIHNLEKDYEYATYLKKIASQIEDKALVIMRAHVEKPRTKHGWKGFLYDPYLDGSNQMLDGIKQTRAFLIELALLGLPVSMEILDPFAYKYYEDLLSYATIGARTCTSQIHRQIASDLIIPVGIKNSIDGNIEAAVHGICFAREPQTFLSFDQEASPTVHTSLGNPLTHLILRGGNKGPNFNKVKEAQILLEKNHIASPILIDCSHGNKIGNSQKEAFECAINSPEVAGLMLESYLKEGVGNMSQKERSVTDYCIGIEETRDWLQNNLIGLNHI